MQHPPRPAGEPILRRGHWISIAAFGGLMTAAVLGALAAALRLGMSEPQAVTVSFLTLAAAQLWHVFDMRRARSSALRNDVTRNPWVWGALALCSGLIAAATQLPGLAGLLDLQPIGSRGWLLVLAFSISPVLSAQLAHTLAGAWRSPKDPRTAPARRAEPVDRDRETP
jgi:Ca2+-transporting ATPase